MIFFVGFWAMGLAMVKDKAFLLPKYKCIV